MVHLIKLQIGILQIGQKIQLGLLLGNSKGERWGPSIPHPAQNCPISRLFP